MKNQITPERLRDVEQKKMFYNIRTRLRFDVESTIAIIALSEFIRNVNDENNMDSKCVIENWIRVFFLLII